MEEPWHERWREGRIGFHEGRANALLERHSARLADRRRVLVPLCGKAEDIAFLAARGFEVVGVELVEPAVIAFFAEHHATPAVTRSGRFAEYRSGAITIFAGDMFATTRELLGPCDAIYDRAALIALPPELQRRYVDHLRTIVPAGTLVLLVTIEYPADAIPGPPFSVSGSQVRDLFGTSHVEQLDEAPTTLRDGAVAAVERCFAITL